MSPWAIVGIVVGSLVAACCIGVVAVAALSPTSANNNGQGASPTASQPVVTNTGIAPQTHAAAATSPPAPTLPADQTYTGHGSKVIKLNLDQGHLHTATITYQGSANFIVTTIDGSGQEIDLLVNEIGGYSGTTPIDFKDTAPAALKIDAAGTWKVIIKVAEEAPLWTGKMSGKGDTVVRISPDAVSGLTTVSFTHNGSSNFVVEVYTHDNWDLLVNEIGSYSGETVLPSDAVLVVIGADGNWTFQAT
jgi:hypothetical protein